MATGGTNIGEKTDHLDENKIQVDYEVDTWKVLLKVKHLLRKENKCVEFVYVIMKKLPIATSVKRLEEVVNCIYEEAISSQLPEGYNRYEYMDELAKLCKLCAEIKASNSNSDAEQVITFQGLLIKIILLDFERISKQPSCEEKLSNWIKNVKGSENKKLEWIKTSRVKMEKNENESTFRSIRFVIELFHLRIVDIKIIYKIVQHIIMMANLISVIECLHVLLTSTKIDLSSLKWENDSKTELLSRVLVKMTELFQDCLTPQTTKNMIQDLVQLWAIEREKEFEDTIESKLKNLLSDVILKRGENPWRSSRILGNFLTEKEAEFERNQKYVSVRSVNLLPQFSQAQSQRERYQNYVNSRSDNLVPQFARAQNQRGEIQKMAEQIAAKEAEKFQKEQKKMQQRLKSQEKKVDYFSRAKRLEEIPLIKKSIEEKEIRNKQFWEEEEAKCLATVVAERELAEGHQERPAHMKDDRCVFLEKIRAQRNAAFQEKLKEFEVKLAEERKKRLLERKEKRKEERRAAWLKECEEEAEQKAEEEQRKKEEEERL